MYQIVYFTYRTKIKLQKNRKLQFEKNDKGVTEVNWYQRDIKQCI